jgi:putative FmdB family regulatory protein
MPIYEYECRSCKEKFEVIQKMSDGNEGLHCPKCETDKPERLLSAFCSGTGRGNTPNYGSAPAHSGAGHS